MLRYRKKSNSRRQTALPQLNRAPFGLQGGEQCPFCHLFLVARHFFTPGFLLGDLRLQGVCPRLPPRLTPSMFIAMIRFKHSHIIPRRFSSCFAYPRCFALSAGPREYLFHTALLLYIPYPPEAWVVLRKCSARPIPCAQGGGRALVL